LLTLTGTEPTAPGGEIAVISVSDTTVLLRAGVEPKFALELPVNPVPVIVTSVCPAVEPTAGPLVPGVVEIEVTVGLVLPRTSETLSRSAPHDDPSGVTSENSTVEVDPVAVTFICSGSQSRERAVLPRTLNIGESISLPFQ
jgi:hypothetical protein